MFVALKLLRVPHPVVPHHQVGAAAVVSHPHQVAVYLQAVIQVRAAHQVRVPNVY